MRGVSSQRVYSSTASFRFQTPLRGSHIPRDTLNTTILRAQIYPSPFWYLARIAKARHYGELNHEKGFL
jgi:hypothetical protein